MRYPGSFARSFPNEATQRDWLETWSIELAGLPPERIGVGLDRLKDRKNDEWPPSLGVFRNLCDYTLAEMGWPGKQQAYEDACKGVFHCDGAYYAANEVGQDRLRRYSTSATHKPFMDAYEDARRRAIRGQDLPTRPAPTQKVEVKPKSEAELAAEHKHGEKQLENLLNDLGSGRSGK